MQSDAWNLCGKFQYPHPPVCRRTKWRASWIADKVSVSASGIYRFLVLQQQCRSKSNAAESCVADGSPGLSAYLLPSCFQILLPCIYSDYSAPGVISGVVSDNLCPFAVFSFLLSLVRTKVLLCYRFLVKNCNFLALRVFYLNFDTCIIQERVMMHLICSALLQSTLSELFCDFFHFLNSSGLLSRFELFNNFFHILWTFQWLLPLFELRNDVFQFLSSSVTSSSFWTLQDYFHVLNSSVTSSTFCELFSDFFYFFNSSETCYTF